MTPECKGKWKVLRANAGETDRVRQGVIDDIKNMGFRAKGTF